MCWNLILRDSSFNFAMTSLTFAKITCGHGFLLLLFILIPAHQPWYLPGLLGHFPGFSVTSHDFDSLKNCKPIVHKRYEIISNFLRQLLTQPSAPEHYPYLWGGTLGSLYKQLLYKQLGWDFWKTKQFLSNCQGWIFRKFKQFSASIFLNCKPFSSLYLIDLLSS